MEREAFLRGMDFLIAKQLDVAEIVTDASSSIRKTLETKYSAVHHSLDVWHKSKKLKKALGEAGKLKGMEKLLKWSGNLVNHFWYCCRTCNGDIKTLKFKWSALLHHVTDEHEWATGACDHEPLVEPPSDRDSNTLQYFAKDEPAFRALQKLIMDKKWLKSMKFYTKFRHTGMLEAFHSLLPGYCSKRTAYQQQAYEARVQLAILDHNAHLERGYARNKDGDIIYHRKYRKQSKKWDASPSKQKKQYKYISELLDKIERERTDTTFNVKTKSVLPADHPARIQRTIGHSEPPMTTDIVTKKQSRFN